MKTIAQFARRLNCTELGARGMKDKYVRMPNDFDMGHFFDRVDQVRQFRYKKDFGKSYEFRYQKTSSGENRVVNVKEFFEENSLHVGDEIFLERVCDSRIGEDLFYVDIKKYDNIVFFQKFLKGFDLLNEDRAFLLNGAMCKENLFTYELLCKERKRKKSKSLTNCYELKIGSQIVSNKGLVYLEVSITDGQASLRKVNEWEFQKYEERNV